VTKRASTTCHVYCTRSTSCAAGTIESPHRNSSRFQNFTRPEVTSELYKRESAKAADEHMRFSEQHVQYFMISRKPSLQLCSFKSTVQIILPSIPEYLAKGFATVRIYTVGK
jgi:hypothetical protein